MGPQPHRTPNFTSKLRGLRADHSERRDDSRLVAFLNPKNDIYCPRLAGGTMPFMRKYSTI